MRARRTIGPAAVSALAVIGLLAGCAGGGQRVEPQGQRAAQRVEPAGQGAGRQVTLSPQQVEAVRAGVIQMIGDAANAQFSRVTALTFAAAPGIHVCGHVTYAPASGEAGGPKRYYVELRDIDGKPTAERGQLGATQRTLAQVDFMCRRHKAG